MQILTKNLEILSKSLQNQFVVFEAFDIRVYDDINDLLNGILFIMLALPGGAVTP